MSKSINFDGDWLSISSPGTANTEFSVAHKLKRIPAGFIVARRSASGIIRPGTTASTSTLSYFISDTAIARYLIILF